MIKTFDYSFIVPVLHRWTWRWDSQDGICYILWPDDPVSEAAYQFECHDFETAVLQGGAWSEYYNERDAYTDARNKAAQAHADLDALFSE